MDSTIISLRPAEPPLTDTALCAWLGAATSGDTIIYHRGMLALDLCKQRKLLPENERMRLAKVASRAWRLAEAGLLHLVQRRRGPEDFEYIAVARPKPRRNANVLALLHSPRAA
jgi:hypothetical protein